MIHQTPTTVTFVKAIADETRQQIMRLCCCTEISVGDIVDALQVSQPTVSHHLAILKTAGLVKTRRDGKQIFYTLDQEKIASNCCNLAEVFSPELKVTIEGLRN
jgi:ArsR family transcriptional regulator, arsenate/arsenite/antimonite-responsive transcriptional repressor